MRPIELLFPYNYRIYRQSIVLHRRSSSGARFRHLAVWLLPVFGTVVLMQGLWARFVRQAPDAEGFMVLAIPCFFFGFVFMAARRWRMYRLFRARYSALGSDLQLRLLMDDAGIETRTAAGVVTLMPWDSFRGYIENDRMMLLYLNVENFVPMIWERMSPEEIARVRSHVVSRLQPLRRRG